MPLPDAPGSVSRTDTRGQTPPADSGWQPSGDDGRAAVLRRPVGRKKDRIWLHVLLLVLTLLAATSVGVDHYAGFLLDFRVRPLRLTWLQALTGGLWYSLSVMAILGAHEMGHYLACRRYGVDASLPYFIPAPGTLIGTFGAFIRIRQPIYTKRQLFDIGIAGPLAGLAVALPALVIGLGLSHVARVPPNMHGLELGEPVLFKAVSWLWWGPIPEGYSLNLHPMALAAWFGLLATLLNLFPALQLDGGHISYAVFGRRARYVTFATLAAALGLTFVSLSWLVWTILIAVMLVAFGPDHPPTLDEAIPLDSSRRLLAVAALIILVLCFTPAPIQPLELIRR
jgi:membrane-associated protease RseP (regulator of RpoE activity)